MYVYLYNFWVCNICRMSNNGHFPKVKFVFIDVRTRQSREEGWKLLIGTHWAQSALNLTVSTKFKFHPLSCALVMTSSQPSLATCPSPVYHHFAEYLAPTIVVNFDVTSYLNVQTMLQPDFRK